MTSGSQDFPALLVARFPDTILSRRSHAPLWFQQSLVVSFILVGSAALAAAILLASTGAVSPLPWLFALVGIGITGAAFLSLRPLYLAEVPTSIQIDGRESVLVLQLSPVPGYARHFTTPEGKLLLVDREALHCWASRAEYLPDPLVASSGNSNRVPTWAVPHSAADDWR